MNYDVAAHRQAILRRELPPGDFGFFDEFHKYRGWRNYLKGLFDEPGRQQRILVTGSARLDLYRFGGDSLQGRYFYPRLHPFSVAELGGHADALPALLALGGFPEPFLSGSERFARRWSLAYRERLVREEVSSLESVSDLGRLELLAGALPARVGSPLSLNSLREDLQVSHQTVTRWTDMLERVYGIFRIAPFGAPMRSGEACQQVTQACRHSSVAELAFDQRDRLAALGDDEVDFAPVDVAEVTQLDRLASQRARHARLRQRRGAGSTRGAPAARARISGQQLTFKSPFPSPPSWLRWRLSSKRSSAARRYKPGPATAGYDRSPPLPQPTV